MKVAISPNQNVHQNNKEQRKPIRISHLSSSDMVCFSSATTKLDNLTPNKSQMQEMEQQLNNLLQGKGKTKTLYLGLYGDKPDSQTGTRVKTNDGIGLSWYPDNWSFETILYGSGSANFKVVQKSHGTYPVKFLRLMSAQPSLNKAS